MLFFPQAADAIVRMKKTTTKNRINRLADMKTDMLSYGGTLNESKSQINSETNTKTSANGVGAEIKRHIRQTRRDKD